ncbi:MAG: 4Fe-4S dicluster domain-containing protein [candidate division WOR-3 bacterium]
MEAYFLPFGKLNSWLSRLSREFTVFVPAEVEGQVHWHRLVDSDLLDSTDAAKPNWALDRIRAAEPVKSFLFRSRELVATFPERLDVPQSERVLLLGVKSCDLRPLQVHQRMFLESGFKDPFYENRLRSTVMVSADCPNPAESCFCNLVGLKPYPEGPTDVNLSVLEGGYLLEMNEGGGPLLEMARDEFRPATDAEEAERERRRAAAVAALERRNPKQWTAGLPQAIEQRTDDKVFWTEAAKGCVECFGCLLGCPTCFCFLLCDQAKNGGVERTRVWDACYMAMYARVGGGVNPRGEFLKRFINRFHCKFMHAKNEWGFYGCSGCGRCLASCLGRIDIREILGRL